MRAFFCIVLGNIRKRKTFFAVIFILSFIGALFLSGSLGIILKTRALYESSYKSSGESPLVYGFHEQTYDSGYRVELEKNKLTESVFETKGLLCTIELSNETVQTVFCPQNENFNYRIFEAENYAEQLSGSKLLAPIDFKNSYGLKSGDRITYGKLEFIIDGFFEDPICGSPFYHTKRCIISPSFFNELYKNRYENELNGLVFLNINIKDEYMNDLKNALTAIEADFKNADKGLFSFNQYRLTSARTMVPNIILAILILVSIFLLAILLIVIRYVIQAVIEDDIPSLGIMKALGFSGGNLTIILLTQYLVNVLIGLAAGTVGAFAAAPYLGKYLLATSGIIWTGSISVFSPLMTITLFLLFSFVTVYFQVRKVKKIKPVQAVRATANNFKGTKNKIYIHLFPLSFFPLSWRMGAKQLLEKWGQYVSLFILISFFTFMLINISGLANAFSSSESTASILGYDMNDIKIEITDSLLADESLVTKLTAYIDENFHITYSSVYDTGYDGYVDDSAVQLLVYSDFQTSNIIEGNYPTKANEIMISSGISDEFEKHVGDSIYISLLKNGVASEYTVVGINNQVYDMGRNITISPDGLLLLDKNFSPDKFLLKIEKNENISQAIEFINGNFAGRLAGIEIINERATTEKRINAIKLTLSTISVSVTVIAAALISAITFLVSIVVVKRETLYVGTLKALGFTPNQLRLQLVARFILISVLGALLGISSSVLADGRLINLLFGLVNISKIPSGVTLFIVIANAAFVTISASLSAWFVSSRFKNLNVRVLLTD